MNIKKDEIQAILIRAKETLDEAKLLLENNYFNAAVNRMYYSSFYAVTALLASKDIKAKRHAGVKQMFGLHFISTGIISEELGQFYTEVFEMRQEGDYEFLVYFEEEDATILFQPAQQLIAQVEEILSRQQ